VKSIADVITITYKQISINNAHKHTDVHTHKPHFLK